MKLDTICISKHMTKQAELLHAYINKAQLTTCEVGVFYIPTLENTPTLATSCCALWQLAT